MPSVQRTHMPEVTELLKLNYDTETLVIGKVGKRKDGEKTKVNVFSFLSSIILLRYTGMYNANNPNLIATQAAEQTSNKW